MASENLEASGSRNPGGGTITSYPMRHTAVTPSDTTLYKPPIALYVGGEGDVVGEDCQGHAVTYTAVQAGSTVPCLLTKVKAATTASNLVGVY